MGDYSVAAEPELGQLLAYKPGTDQCSPVQIKNKKVNEMSGPDGTLNLGFSATATPLSHPAASPACLGMPWCVHGVFAQMLSMY